MSVHLRNSVIPKHEQLRTILLRKCTHELRAGDIIASERNLMEEYGVSRITVREAIGQLVNDGYLVRVRGKGTFVAHRAVQSKLHLASFTEEMLSLGYQPTTVVLISEKAKIPEKTSFAMGMEPNINGYHVKRLRLADGDPVSVDDSWFNPELFPGLLELDLTGSIYRAISENYGSSVDHAEQTVRADSAEAKIASLLGTRKGAPLLHFDRVSFSNGTPVEHTRSWYRSDRYQLKMEVKGDMRNRSSGSR